MIKIWNAEYEVSSSENLESNEHHVKREMKPLNMKKDVDSSLKFQSSEEHTLGNTENESKNVREKN